MKHKTSGITLIALVITIIVLLILAGITINALTGSDSAPAKANEAEQQNDIGTVRDDVALQVQNAHLDAYDDVYVQGNSDVSLSGASTAIGQKVIDAVIKNYGGSLTRDAEGKIKCEKTIGKATLKIEQESGKDAKITISTRDDEKKGTIDYDGGMLTWGEKPKKMIHFSIISNRWGFNYDLQAEEGMTWKEWIDSEYYKTIEDDDDDADMYAVEYGNGYSVVRLNTNYFSGDIINGPSVIQDGEIYQYEGGSEPV